MTAVLQRIRQATVYADGLLSGEVGHGLYILLGVENGDDIDDAAVLAEKIAKLRIFEDAMGKMNLSVQDVDGEIMVVSNFTLAADYSHGNRPSYIGAAAPAIAEALYDRFVSMIGSKVKKVATGKFGADMRTDMQTDGPVTIVMHSSVLRKK
ncbi:MAG: D-tyrosyl-tRNA(Tyr) deacylase [Clostridia bacterium]|nr:D-tyrosyl-tRNA(Tyr) deacylase [Clostridia bacterium]MBR2325056.1 D-tyrosyl-tRNA(Tyr) deacylase [Clostridia bacterium]